MTETNVDRLNRFSDSVVGGRMDETVTVLHPDFRIRQAASLPYGGVYNGVEGWNELWSRVSGKRKDFAIVSDEPLGARTGISPVDDDDECRIGGHRNTFSIYGSLRTMVRQGQSDLRDPSAPLGCPRDRKD
ncbi:hypothetical protein [Rhodococcus opacus]|uniref:hypothetical protein n=1 Tax=Rhodococcus opacus TaxID=37919 RepID=UPI001009EE9B|nr:hypothetical protein [Rhodococcus opacus]